MVNDSYPNDEHHGWKFIAFGPDGQLYVPVGAPCNICAARGPATPRSRGMKPDGTGREIFARGVRNTVGFDWHPATKELWFTDNGRDMLGDDIPPDELNRAPEAGAALRLSLLPRRRDPPTRSSARRQPCARDARRPRQKLGPHVAALGMRFYTGTMFPPEYREQIFIAEHGSWNRSQQDRLPREPGRGSRATRRVVLRDLRRGLAAGRRRSGAARWTCW